MKITVVIGNPSAGGRTTELGVAVAKGISDLLEIHHEVEAIELASFADGLFAWDSASVKALVARVAEPGIVVFATPTYKASYTGLLKAFLDRYDTGGLKGTVAVPVFTGGSPDHALAPNHTLRPLLVELGASVPTASLYLVTSQFERKDEIVAKFIASERYALLGAAHGLALAAKEAPTQ
jgi:FMN reductase